MYTKEEILNKNMFDMCIQVIPPKYTVKFNKLYPYQQTVPGHVPEFDSYDPKIVQDIYNWIKESTDVERLELPLGAITVDAPNSIIKSDSATNSYTIELNDLICNMDGDADFVVPDGPDVYNPDGIWMILEFTPKADNTDIIFSSNVGNYQIDIAGGTGRKSEQHYDIADGNHRVILPMRVFSPDPGWVVVKHFGVTIKGHKLGDIVEVNDIKMYQIRMKP